jgi:protocatechuate 3,4-dioxygenase beta subunit
MCKKRTLLVFILSVFFILNACSQSKTETAAQQHPRWAGAFEAPKTTSWRTLIAPKTEPGERLIISGTVYLPDGKTPAKDVIVYVYHTNHQGFYPKKGTEKGHGKYHGYLRGWMKTDANGRYEFETIRPAPYETHEGEPAHIHYTIEAANYPEYWLTGLWFSDDPRVKNYRDKIERDGGFSNITTVTKDSNNILRGTRNILLQKFED